VAPITDDTKHELHAASDAHKVVASVVKIIAATVFTTNFILTSNCDKYEYGNRCESASSSTAVHRLVGVLVYRGRY